MYLGLPGLSYRLVPRAGSPACPGQAALGPEKDTGRTALGTKMYPGQSAPRYMGQGHFNLFFSSDRSSGSGSVHVSVCLSVCL